MNFTDSPDAVVHAGTGNPMHDDSGPVDTVWAAKDANMIIWSLMKLLADAGVSAASFNPAASNTYDRVSLAVQAMATPVSGTFTPTVAFGGGSTGVTYSAQAGNYRRWGDLVYIGMHVALTSKGSDSGTVTIGGLPFDAVGVAPMPITAHAMSGLGGSVKALTLAGVPEIELRVSGATGDGSVLTDAACTNTTNFFVAGVYRRA